MKLSRRQPPLMLMLVAALVALLTLLATLQYRWLGQVSQGERERMQQSLRAGSSRFGQDFNREITRAFLNFQLEKASPTEHAGAAYAERYDNWMRSAPYPGLLSELFMVEMDAPDAPRLSRFNREASRFEPADWPAEFASLRQRFEQEHRSYNSQDGADVEISLAPIAEEIPALVIPTVPLAPFIPPDSGKMFKEVARPPIPGYTILKLNQDYIRREFIPALARSYFSSSDGLDYNLTVVSRSRPGDVIYTSDAGGQSFEARPGADATANIFDLRLDQFDVLVLERNVRAGDAQPLTPPARPFQGLRIARVQAPPPRPEEPEKERRSRSVTFRYHNSIKEDQSGAVAAMNDADGRWQLLIQHRAGSLEAAVALARRRNLMVSFGVLLLLAASVGLILISTARARKLARQQMEFVAGVSHELRTPLAVICSAGENLADGVARAPLQVEQYGALIRNEGRRLTKMVEQVLEFAGAQAGRKTFELRAVGVADLVGRALDACQPLVEEGGFKVDQEIEQGLPKVLADRASLERALQNLLTNAMKYAGESRWIGLRARRGEESTSQEVRITVEDRGAGISTRDLPHIFEPFYRGQEATANQIHGSGLGLSLVKQTVEAHGGRITVESKPGRGSAFTLHIPAAVVAAEPQSARAGDDDATRQQKRSTISRQRSATG
ncbi:MAG TPA: HAMP domain-containing sensor histidine kinase [Pyrinomonadaceae bacterium]